MVKLKVQPNELPDDIYLQSKLNISKLILGAILIFIVAFFFNFPISKIIKSKLTAAITSNRACPISYEDIQFEWFMPKLIIKKPNIAGTCFNSPGSSLKLQDLVVKLQSPSFWPLGLKFHTKIKHKLTVLNLYPTIGMSRQVIKIEKSSVSHDTLREILGRKAFKFSGDFEINALVKVNQGNLTSGDILISSSNVNLPPQNVSGLIDLPAMPIGQFQFKSSINAKNLLELKEIRLGNANSPILANLEGNIKLNPHNSGNSNLDLLGEVKFSQTVLESFSILNAMLSGKQMTDKGFYKFKVKGRLSSPIPSFQ
jgi:CRISPR/Cas system endoribonuclease Cas6 (RAMP superfamily)